MPQSIESSAGIASASAEAPSRTQKIKMNGLRLGAVLVTTASAFALTSTGAAESPKKEANYMEQAKPLPAWASEGDPNMAAMLKAGEIIQYVSAVEGVHQRDIAVLHYLAGVVSVQKQANSTHSQGGHNTHYHAGASVYSGSGPGGLLACIRHAESRGNYAVVNGNSGAGGAYQFMPTTWNNNARDAGRPDLIGVNPAAVSPADQDAMARHLYATQGVQPWRGDPCVG